MVRLFDIEHGKVIPTEHCYTIQCYKTIMEEYKEEHVLIYTYLFYLCCPNPELNPFFDVPDVDKEYLIRREIGGEFDSDDLLIQNALEFTKELYSTPTTRAYEGIKMMLDNLAEYMKTAVITDKKDGNLTALINAAKSFKDVRESFKGTLKDLQEEQQATVRGAQTLAYDA